MSSPRNRRTDYGTVLLHWLVVVTLLLSVATGLRFAADSPTLAWLRYIDWLLPQGNLWGLHSLAGLVLIAASAAYVVYLVRARLARRVTLDRARVAGIARSGRVRWGAVNVVLYWALFAVLLVQFVSGILLYLGFGGAVVTAHLMGTWLLLAYPILHVAAQWAYGGGNQLLRVFRPSRPVLGLAPQSLAEILAEHLASLDGSERSQRRSPHQGAQTEPRAPDAHVTRLSSHPLAVALTTGLAAAAILLSADQSTRDILTVGRIEKAQAPVLDGDLSDPIWRAARPVVVRTNQGANFDATGATTIEIRAVHDGTNAYLAFVWDDPTRSLKHLPLVKQADGWHLVHEQYDIEDEDSFYEDKFAVLLATSDAIAGGGSVHLGTQPLPDRPGGLSRRGLHYTTDGTIVDVWHWKASRGGLLGYMDDNYFGPPAEPTTVEIAGTSRYKAGYQTDPGKAFYSANFKAQPPGGYAGPLQPVRLPRDLAATAAAMGRIDLDPNHGESDGARWWMTVNESVPYSAAADAAIPMGTVIPGVLIGGEYSGDRADVRCAARWGGGRWTLEVMRRLDTGSAKDIAIANGVFMWVAAFDHSQTRHTRHLRPIRLEVK